MAVYSVAQLNHYIKNMFVQDYLLSNVSVEGEISNLKVHPTGHIYFTLKDESATISGVMFAGNKPKGLKCKLSEGLRVVISGMVDVYEAGGKYQIYAKTIEEKGQGDLYKKFLELKNRLEEMGMFDASFKKPIPKYVKTVGIVTASSGAALQDIINIATRRNPYVQLVLSPALVQGVDAPQSLVKAIKRMDAYHPDVMIVGRGGGSLEDLWAFNDEQVARAIFDCDTPVISAVGHEVDFTIADFVSDLRAPTPSAAAELAIFESRAYLEQLANDETRMEKAVENLLLNYRNRLKQLKLRLEMNHPSVRLQKQQELLRTYEERLHRSMHEKMEKLTNRLGLLTERLNGKSPLQKLVNGYGYLQSKKEPVRSVKEVQIGDELLVTLHDGTIQTSVQSVEEK